MKEAPILFNQAMMPRVLDGSKSQTRRPIKVPDGGSARATHDVATELLSGARTYDAIRKEYGWQKPIANVGDVLWVRETWADFCPLWPHWCGCGSKTMQSETHRAVYMADDPSQQAGWAAKWRPSIHMPRWASRVTLPLVSVRVERVSDISDDDAVAEGFDRSVDFGAAWFAIYGVAEWCFVYEWSKAVIAGGSRE